jgi:tripartite-type tricarboxylate transporter receptor subunit TctC
VTSFGTPLHINTMLMTTALHLPVQTIVGYKGTAEIRQAMASRELDGACVGLDAYLATFEPKEDFRVLVQLGGGDTDLGAVPALSTLVTAAPDQDLVRFMALMGQISRYYAVPAGTPDEVVSSLRQAFEDTMRDPDFLQAAKRAQLPINPRSASQIEKSVTELLNLPSALRERVEAIAKPPAP